MPPLIKAIAIGLIATASFIYLVTELSVERTPDVANASLLKMAAAKPPALSGPVSYSSAVKAASPAVVNINTEKIVTVRSHPFFSDPLFKQMFGKCGYAM